ncbi:MAG: putative counterpart of the neighbouring HigB-like protein [Acidobacteriaceae bacterium]|nr:putative counterpart of the neighbouring HigB-like protein [Acidobacteriaceae bacterium]
MRMYNPAHPGEVLREFMGDMTVSDLAGHLGVTRVTLSRLINGNSGVSAEMALRLSEAFRTSPELWLNMQTQYDLWQASQARKEKVTAIKRRLLEPNPKQIGTRATA